MIIRSTLRLAPRQTSAPPLLHRGRRLLPRPFAVEHTLAPGTSQRLLALRHSFSSTSRRPISAADEKVEHLTDLYNSARDEFEMAAEETEKQTVYAAADRQAAREELDRLTAAFREAVREGVGDPAMAEEVRRRVGQRVRELESAVVAMEEAAAGGG